MPQGKQHVHVGNNRCCESSPLQAKLLAAGGFQLCQFQHSYLVPDSVIAVCDYTGSAYRPSTVNASFILQCMSCEHYSCLRRHVPIRFMECNVTRQQFKTYFVLHMGPFEKITTHLQDKLFF